MFEYTHQVLNSNNQEFGIFKNIAQATIMKNALEAKFKDLDTFRVEEIR